MTEYECEDRIYALTAERDALKEKLRVAIEALDNFYGLESAYDPRFEDDVIIRCEVTAKDIRIMMLALAKIKGGSDE